MLQIPDEVRKFAEEFMMLKDRDESWRESVMLGMTAEMAFAEAVGAPYELCIYQGRGDRGVDVTVGLSFTVDVKAAKVPKFLLQGVGKPFADIFVLADVSGSTVEFVGWAWGDELASSPLHDFGAGPSHYMAAAALEPMERLYRGSNVTRRADGGLGEVE